MLSIHIHLPVTMIEVEQVFATFFFSYYIEMFKHKQFYQISAFLETSSSTILEDAVSSSCQCPKSQ